MNFLEEILWEKSITIGNQIFVPVVGESTPTKIRLANEFHEYIRVEELENEAVNSVYFRSEVDLPILVVSGLIVQGGKQTRIITRPFILERPKKVIIPVNCIEKGRWNYETTTQFRFTNKMASRKTKSSAIRGKRAQSLTWETIRKLREKYSIDNSYAPTENYLHLENAILEQRKDSVEKAKITLEPVFSLKKQRGILFFENGMLAFAEVFDSSEKWNKIKNQILEANLIET